MDCNKTTNFLAELQRLCSSRARCEANAANEEECPMYIFCMLTHSQPYAENAKKTIENLQKWSDEHPKKTYAQDFFEKFPKAQSYTDGTPLVCRKGIYGGVPQKDKDCYMGECENCWNEPMEE